MAKLLIFQFLAKLPAWITLACYITASLHVPHKDLGLALGLIGTFRFLGSAVGTTIYSQILNNRATSDVATRVVDAVRDSGYPVADVRALINSISEGTASSANINSQALEGAMHAYKQGWSSAFRITWLATIPFGVTAFVLSFLVKNPSLYFTNHTAVRLERETFGHAAVHEDGDEDGVGRGGVNVHNA